MVAFPFTPHFRKWFGHNAEQAGRNLDLCIPSLGWSLIFGESVNHGLPILVTTTGSYNLPHTRKRHGNCHIWDEEEERSCKCWTPGYSFYVTHNYSLSLCLNHPLTIYAWATPSYIPLGPNHHPLSHVSQELTDFTVVATNQYLFPILQNCYSNWCLKNWVFITRLWPITDILFEPWQQPKFSVFSLS